MEKIASPSMCPPFPAFHPLPPSRLCLCGWPLEQLEAKAPQAPEQTAARLKESPSQDMQVEKVTQDLSGWGGLVLEKWAHRLENIYKQEVEKWHVPICIYGWFSFHSCAQGWWSLSSAGWQKRAANHKCSSQCRRPCVCWVTVSLMREFVFSWRFPSIQLFNTPHEESAQAWPSSTILFDALELRLNAKSLRQTQALSFYSHRWSELQPPFFHRRNACRAKDEGENCCCLSSSSPHSVPGRILGLSPVLGFLAPLICAILTLQRTWSTDSSPTMNTD